MKNFFKHSRARLGFLILIILSIFSLTFYGGEISYLLRTSIVGYPEHEPFDGTVYPVEKAPDWVNLSSEKWDFGYDSLSSGDLINIPNYDPNQLKMSTDDLEWGDVEDNKIRNAKITYSVPYMGNYLLDGKEYAGSHLAVDIKIPNGTPVYAIANGTVIKTSDQTSGFGHHIVLQHNNFPTLDDPDANETIYSSYSHLDDLFVSEGDVVTKGEQIADSGDTGTATTPHLHFQIDNDEAPWHPFWPFTWQDLQDAGLDFYSGINEGLGQDIAIATTINPVKYVQAYLNGSYEADGADDGSDSADEGADAESYVPEEPEENTVEEEVEDVVEEIVIEEVVLDPPVLNFKFELRSKYYVDQNSDYNILLRDQYGDVFEGFTGEVVISSSNGLVTCKPAIISNRDFDRDGVLEAKFSKMAEGREKLKIEYEGETYYSDWFEIIDETQAVSFSDLPEDHEYYDAVMYLVAEDVVSGYPDGTFQPDKTVSRVEALKFIFEGIKVTISTGDLPFNDVVKGEWYGGYLYTAYSKGVVDGYPDGSFKPANTVNKAEFYKILFNGMGIDINPNIEVAPFEDVSPGEWYAPFVAYAKEIGVIDEDVVKLDAGKGMSRGEVADAIYRLMLIMK
jgi:murein DD-endopeptidase MepM/ murein hydrolase activator NlpD